MSKYRKKPVVIEATPWFQNGDHPDDYVNSVQGFERGVVRTFSGEHCREMGWEGQVVRYFRRPDVPGSSACRHCGKTMHVHGWINTKEGGHIVCPGDWIITGIVGEHYTCKDSVFRATYEPVQG